MVQIVYGDSQYFKSFYKALGQVASERVYIEMLEAPPFEDVVLFQSGLIQKKAPVFYAVDNSEVVGWIDITPKDNPRMSHRGGLGMGIIADYRSRGIGTQLMNNALSAARQFGFEKVELLVYTSNTQAVKLYKKTGFKEEGLIKKYRKIDGIYFDCLMMAYELS